MDRDLAAQLFTLIGTALIAALCWWRYAAAKKRYVPVDLSRYEGLQDSLNGLRWATTFVAAFILVLQPAWALQYSPPSGWAALAGGLLALAGVVLQPLRRLGIGFGTRRSDAGPNELQALLRREIERGWSDRVLLLVVAPFFAGAAILISTRLGTQRR